MHGHSRRADTDRPVLKILPVSQVCFVILRNHLLSPKTHSEERMHVVNGPHLKDPPLVTLLHSSRDDIR